MTEPDTIITFTARSPKRILAEGGSQAWKLNPANAKRCHYLVCVQNGHHPDHEFSDATEPHGTAFLVGKISGIEPSPEGRDGRWLIAISEYTRISIPGFRDGSRNPVRYGTIAELGIDVAALQFEPISETTSSATSPAMSPRASQTPMPSSVLAEAKQAVAAAFGVKLEAVEITIRV